MKTVYFYIFTHTRGLHISDPRYSFYRNKRKDQQ